MILLEGALLVNASADCGTSSTSLEPHAEGSIGLAGLEKPYTILYA